MRCLLPAILLTSLLLPGQEGEPRRPTGSDYAKTRAWWDRLPEDGALRVLVVVREGAEDLVLARGTIDGELPADQRSWVPMLRASALALDELTLAEVASGLDLGKGIRAAAPRLAANLDAALQRVSVSELLEGETGCLFYERRLRVGEQPRPLADVVAAHAFQPQFGSTWGRTNTRELLLQLILEERLGRSWDALVRNEVSQAWGDAELWPTRPASVPAVHRRDGGELVPILDREVPSAGGLHVRLGDLPSVLRSLSAADRSRRGWSKIEDEEGERIGWSFRESEGSARLRVLCYDAEGRPSAFCFSAYEPEDRYLPVAGQAQECLEFDLGLGDEPEDSVLEGGWNSAVGLGGGAGGRFGGRRAPPALDQAFAGSWETVLPRLGTGEGRKLELVVPGSDPEAARVWLEGRPLNVRSSGNRRELTVWAQAPEFARLEIRVSPADGVLRADAVVRTNEGDSLPWRLEFRETEAERSWPPWLPRVVKETGLAERVRALHEEVRAGGGLFAVSNVQGLRWMRSFGHADAAGRVPMSSKRLIPLHSLSRTISALAGLEVLFDPEVEVGFDTQLREVWGERAPALPERLGKITLGMLAYNAVFPEFEVRSTSSIGDAAVAELLERHAHRRPAWVSGSPHDDLSVALLAEALTRANGYRSWDAHVARGYGRESFYEVTGAGMVGRAAQDLERIGPEGTLSWSRGFLPGVSDFWGLPIDALRLGEIVLWQLASAEDREETVDLLRCEQIEDGGGRGFDGLLWEDDLAGECLRLTVWPELDLVVFGFANHAGMNQLRALERAVLDGYEQGNAFSSGSFGRANGAFDVAGTFVASVESADGPIGFELSIGMKDIGQGDFEFVVTELDARVDGAEVRVTTQYQGEDRLVFVVPYGQGELAFAVETSWLGNDLSGVVIVRDGGGNRLPRPVTLRRKK